MKKAKKSKLGLFIILGFLVYFSFLAADQQKIFDAKEREKSKVQANIDKEKDTNAELKEQKEMLNSEEYYEKVAREKLNMVKPGEKVFVDVGK